MNGLKNTNQPTTSHSLTPHQTAHLTHSFPPRPTPLTPKPGPLGLAPLQFPLVSPLPIPKSRAGALVRGSGGAAERHRIGRTAGAEPRRPEGPRTRESRLAGAGATACSCLLLLGCPAQWAAARRRGQGAAALGSSAGRRQAPGGQPQPGSQHPATREQGGLIARYVGDGSVCDLENVVAYQFLLSMIFVVLEFYPLLL